MRIDAQLSVHDPILCAHLLRKVDQRVVDLMQSLTSDEWNLQTIAPRWKVRDVAAHLLDTALRKLSLLVCRKCERSASGGLGRTCQSFE
jgi:Mycothiol maleylpyruvate isomerase N-terminal domain